VTVRYNDGKIIADTKYKKVKDDVDSGKCVVI
jgi:5-methylcytosine-specific restriction endonuclease McrBC regulatory subunit McrC